METTNSEQTTTSEEPVRLAYLTSFREIYGDRGGELAGRQVICEETGQNLGYRTGNLEGLLNLINDPASELGQDFRRRVELALVFHDDSDRQMLRMGLNQDSHYEQGNWPWPHEQEIGDGRSVHDITQRIPLYTREWRQARREGNSELAEEIRSERELALTRLLIRERIDIILTDCITYIFQDGMAILNEYEGRALNFHPAITAGPTSIPGLHTTRGALMRFNEGRIFGEGRGENIEIIDVPHLRGYNRHGMTLHELIAEIDAGPVVHSEENVEIREGDSRQTLRHRQFAQQPEVLARGLIKFITRGAVREAIADARQKNSVDARSAGLVAVA